MNGTEGYGERAERAAARLTYGMISVALIALGALVADYGGGPGGYRSLWRQLEMVCGMIFILLQCAKPVIVPRPLEYIRRHRLDFILILILLFGLLGAAAVRQSPEFEYLLGHGAAEPLQALPVLAIQGYLIFLVLLKSPWFHRALLELPLGASTALWTSFAGLILLGTVLLRLPGAAADGVPTGWVDALFTATSAACVTGLVVVDTGGHFSGFGQGVILALIQIGGLGVLTLTGSVALLASGTLSRDDHEDLADIADADALPRIRAALVRPLLLTVAIEVTGTLLLLALWWDPYRDLGQQVWDAVFHAVSAFCNAGFSLYADSMTQFDGSPATLLVVALLIVSGGLGFGVLWDLFGRAAVRLLGGPAAPLERQTRVALLAIGVLIPAGGLAIWWFERRGALSHLDGVAAPLNALFLSVSARTAGFNTFDLAPIGLAGSMTLIALMLIGGAPGSAAGGVKTTTFWALFDRRVPPTLRLRALIIILALPASCLLTGFVLHAAGPPGVPGLWFEAPEISRLALVGGMLFGRLGPFLIAFSLRRRARLAGRDVDSEPYLVG